MKHTLLVESLAELLIKYSDIFSKDSDDSGRTGINKHRIQMGEAMPIKTKTISCNPQSKKYSNR